MHNTYTCNWSSRLTRWSLSRLGGTSRVTIIILLNIFCLYSLHAQTIIQGGDVSGVWTPEASPYLIQGDISIPTDSTLQILAGTEIEFQGHYSWTIYGWVYALGSESGYIYINSQDTATGWAGMRFFNQVYPKQDSSLLKYCLIGYANNLNKSGKGGAIYCKNSTRLILEYIDIYNCKADSGAGIFLQNSPISIRTVSIHGCFSDRGGGAFFHSSSPDVENVSIFGNTGNVCGGLNLYKSGGNYNNITILHNHSNGGGGGLVINRSCNPIFENSGFIDNTAKGSGGGIAILQSSNPVFNYCRIDGNETILDQYETLGAGVFITRFENFPQFKNCTIINNICTGNGGGIYTGDEVNILNCQISDNTANTETGIGGGGIYSAEGSVLIMNTTMVDNHGLKGESIYSNGSTIGLYNSIIWNNTGILQNHIYLSGFILPATFSCNYNDIQDGDLSIGIEGTITLNYGSANIDTDPLFESIIGQDYNLTENSPCIARGTLDTLALFVQLLDLNHNARIVHYSIDMGAYENQGGVYVQKPKVQDVECRIYPNPFTNVVNIELNTFYREGVIKILTIEGREVLEDNLNADKKYYHYSLSKLKDGTYILLVKIKNNTYTHRIVKM